MLPKAAKASSHVSLSLPLLLAYLPTHVANVNEPLYSQRSILSCKKHSSLFCNSVTGEEERDFETDTSTMKKNGLLTVKSI
jgi:hypothetical protein